MFSLLACNLSRGKAGWLPFPYHRPPPILESPVTCNSSLNQYEIPQQNPFARSQIGMGTRTMSSNPSFKPHLTINKNLLSVSGLSSCVEKGNREQGRPAYDKRDPAWIHFVTRNIIRYYSHIFKLIFKKVRSRNLKKTTTQDVKFYSQCQI